MPNQAIISLIELTDRHIILSVNGEEHRLAIDEVVFKDFLGKYRQTSFQFADKIYNIEQIATANFDSYLKNIVDKAKQLNRISKTMPQQVIGRLGDAETVRRLLTANNTLVIVNGLGGIGKTVLSHYYWQQYQAEYKHLIWLSGEGDLENALLLDSLLHRNLQLTDTIAPYLEAIKAANNADAKQNALDCIYQSLAELGKPCLLIIDNAEEQHQQTIKQWATNLPNFHLLISSRHKMDDVDTHYLGTLHPTDAIELFYFYNNQIPKNADNNALVERVCELAGYHTLAIELLAKTLSSRHDLNLKQLADELSKKVVYIPKKAQVSTNYTQMKGNIDAVLEFCFDISQLQDDEAALYLLLQLSVLPSAGIKADHLRQMLDITEEVTETHEAVLQKLIQRGWVQHEYADAHEYSCHALIQEIVRHKLQANTDKCIYIIVFLINKIKEIHKINPLQAAIWLPYCNSILQKISDENKIIAVLANNAASIYHYIGDFPQSLAYYNKALAIREKVLPADHPDFASSYNNIGGIYYVMGNFPQSLTYYQQALAIREKVLPADHPDLASSYHKLGAVYQAMGNFPQSLAYYNKALAIQEKVLPADHPDLANSYGILVLVYYNLSDWENVIAFAQKALEILTKALPPEHPNRKEMIDGMEYIIAKATKRKQ